MLVSEKGVREQGDPVGHWEARAALQMTGWPLPLGSSKATSPASQAQVRPSMQVMLCKYIGEVEPADAQKLLQVLCVAKLLSEAPQPL